MDIDEELEKYKLIQQKNDKTIQKYDRVYTPTYTLDFDRKGELLLYSATPNKNKFAIFNQFPYNMVEQTILFISFGFLANIFNLAWTARVSTLYLIPFLMNIRRKQLEDRKFHVRQLKMLRGGKVLKVVREDIFGDTFTEWCEVQYVKPIAENFLEFDDRDNAQFLNQEGQLNYKLAIELENYKVKSRNVQNQNLYFVEDGIVHEPEVFEAVMKGYHVDTSNFTINTADNERALEPHYNM